MALDEATKDRLKAAIGHHQNGSLDLAEEAYQQVLEAAPDQPDALNLLGVLCCQKGDFQGGAERIEQSLQIQPDQPGAHNNAGNAYVQLGQWESAANHFEQAVKLKPDYAEAHKHLANVYAEMGRAEESITHYQVYLKANPRDENAMLLVAEVSEDHGDLERALEGYRAVLAVNDKSADAYRRVGAILRRLGRLDEARQNYAQLLAIHPKDAEGLHFANIGLDDRVPQRASPAYVTAVFDAAAPTFEARTQALGYRVPELLQSCLAAEDWPVAERAVDLGCGTGLCGRATRAFAKQLEGVDLSTGMLKRAGEAAVYDQLHHADIVEFLGKAEPFHLIVSGDTFIYFGDLQPLLAAVHKSLVPDGRIAFSLEAASPTSSEGFQLGVSGRYRHSLSYVQTILNEVGLKTLAQRSETIRKETGKDVPGHVFLAQRLANA